MQIVSNGDNFMNCQTLFSGKNKKKFTNLSSAELVQRRKRLNTHFCKMQLNNIIKDKMSACGY